MLKRSLGRVFNQLENLVAEIPEKCTLSCLVERALGEVLSHITREEHALGRVFDREFFELAGMLGKCTPNLHRTHH